ncbi:MAG TPA: helix-turn-helix domain-containing protein [Solirubrobacterales bacterium]|nr:helix-turn-helix domain-containing protein [Solirubrobacterales bacterium]
MLQRDYQGQDCSIAATLELIGERWTILVIRDIWLGRRRFGQIQENLGIARNVLSSRLQRLLDAGILERRIYSERPERYEYFLTEKGLDLWPVMVAMIGWGDRHLAGPEGPAVAIVHKECGGAVNDRRICERCGAALEVRDARAVGLRERAHATR